MKDKDTYKAEMKALGQVKAPKDFLQQVNNRLEQGSAFDRILKTLLLPFKASLSFKLAAAVATLILVAVIYQAYLPYQEIPGLPQPKVAMRKPVVAPKADKPVAVAQKEPAPAVAIIPEKSGALMGTGPEKDMEADVMASRAEEEKSVLGDVMEKSAAGGMASTGYKESRAMMGAGVLKTIIGLSAPAAKPTSETPSGIMSALREAGGSIVTIEGKTATVRVPAANYGVLLKKLAGRAEPLPPIPMIASSDTKSVILRLKFIP